MRWRRLSRKVNGEGRACRRQNSGCWLVLRGFAVRSRVMGCSSLSRRSARLRARAEIDDAPLADAAGRHSASAAADAYV
jgi:hypothetical protein